MAMGNYPLATQEYRPTHVGSGRATSSRASMPDIPGLYDKGFQTFVKAGLDFAQGIIDVGKALQSSGRSAHKIGMAGMERRIFQEEAANEGVYLKNTQQIREFQTRMETERSIVGYMEWKKRQQQQKDKDDDDKRDSAYRDWL